MKQFLNHSIKALLFSLIMFVLCGLIYPLALTGVSQFVFPSQAHGSQIKVDGQVVASEIVGQDFSDLRLFHCRPSAYKYNTYTQEEKALGEYAGLASGSHNYASSNPELSARIDADIEAFLNENPTIQATDIPSDLITASGSGLDPHISLEAANVQIDRVAEHSGLSKDVLKKMVQDHVEGKVLGIFGEDKVNVVKLNLAVAQAIGMIECVE